MFEIGRWVARHISPSRPPRKTWQYDIFAMIPPLPTPTWTRNISMRPTWSYCSANTRPPGCGSVFFAALPSGHVKIPGGRAPDPIRAKSHSEDPTGQVTGRLPAGKPPPGIARRCPSADGNLDNLPSGHGVRLPHAKAERCP